MYSPEQAPVRLPVILAAFTVAQCDCNSAQGSRLTKLTLQVVIGKEHHTSHLHVQPCMLCVLHTGNAQHSMQLSNCFGALRGLDHSSPALQVCKTASGGLQQTSRPSSAAASVSPAAAGIQSPTQLQSTAGLQSAARFPAAQAGLQPGAGLQWSTRSQPEAGLWPRRCTSAQKEASILCKHHLI